MRYVTDRIIDGFTDWFGSALCVVETSVVCIGLAVAEAWWPSVDPNNLHYLYALTVYSAITQPALAYAAERLARFLREMVTLLVQLSRSHAEEQETLVQQSETIAAQTAAIVDVLNELKRIMSARPA